MRRDAVAGYITVIVTKHGRCSKRCRQYGEAAGASWWMLVSRSITNRACFVRLSIPQRLAGSCNNKSRSLPKGKHITEQSTPCSHISQARICLLGKPVLQARGIYEAAKISTGCILAKEKQSLFEPDVFSCYVVPFSLLGPWISPNKSQYHGSIDGSRDL